MERPPRPPYALVDFAPASAQAPDARPLCFTQPVETLAARRLDEVRAAKQPILRYAFEDDPAHVEGRG